MKKSITFKYITPYIHKKNTFAKKQQIIITIKDLSFLNSRLLLDFQAKIVDITNYL